MRSKPALKQLFTKAPGLLNDSVGEGDIPAVRR
jgi:hypothetical protein